LLFVAIVYVKVEFMVLEKAWKTWGIFLLLSGHPADSGGDYNNVGNSKDAVMMTTTTTTMMMMTMMLCFHSEMLLCDVLRC